MKDQSKASDRELSKEEITNLSDEEFKALVIKMLIEMIELGRKMKEQMKDTPNEIKQNIHVTNREGKETRTQINNLEQKKEISIQLEQKKKQEFKKLRRGLGTSRTTLNVPTSKL